MLFLPRLYIIHILYVVAQATLRSAGKKPSVYTTSPVAACVLRFCSRYRPVIPTELDSRDRTMNITASSLPPPHLPAHPLPRIRAPFLAPFVFAYATLAAFGPQVEREQIRYPLTSTGEFEVLIAVNPTVVCSRARLTRVISALQGSRRVVHIGVFPARETRLLKRGELVSSYNPE